MTGAEGSDWTILPTSATAWIIDPKMSGLIFVQSSMADIPRSIRQMEECGMQVTVVGETDGPFRDYYFRDPDFIPEMAFIPGSYTVRDGVHHERLIVFDATLPGGGSKRAVGCQLSAGGRSRSTVWRPGAHVGVLAHTLASCRTGWCPPLSRTLNPEPLCLPLGGCG